MTERRPILPYLRVLCSEKHPDPLAYAQRRMVSVNRNDAFDGAGVVIAGRFLEDDPPLQVPVGGARDPALERDTSVYVVLNSHRPANGHGAGEFLIDFRS